MRKKKRNAGYTDQGSTENEPLLFTLNSDGVSFTVKANEGVEFTGELLIPSTESLPDLIIPCHKDWEKSAAYR